MGIGVFFGPGSPFENNEAMPNPARARQAAATERRVLEQQSELKDLQERLDRMTLMNQALWEIVRARLQLSDADLEKMAQEIDLRDGSQDGKYTSHPLKCPNCGRVSNSRHKKCLYCGLLFEGDAFA